MCKKCKVVMLATDKIVENRPDYYIDALSLFISDHPKGHNVLSLMRSTNGLNIINPQHLYILSDDKIKEGDYCFVLNQIIKAENEVDVIIANDNKYPKVIATTDSFITGYDDDGQPMDKNGNIAISLPSIPQSFIDKYVSEYNKGNKIEEVMVEYVDNGEEDWIGDNYNGEPFWNEKIELKLNPDNTINIKSIKDSWTREEVEQLLINLASECLSSNGTVNDPVTTSKWIKTNL